MTEQDYELLSQYIDGELTPPRAQSLRERLIAEPALRAELDRMRQVNGRVVSALRGAAERGPAERGPADTHGIPAELLRALQEGKAGANHLPTVRRAGWGLALAASILAAAGILLNPQFTGHRGADPDTLLADLLEQRASGTEDWQPLSDGRRARTVLTFRSRQGTWCREYLVDGDDADLHGVACREGGSWHTRVVTAVALPDAHADYAPAGALDSEGIERFVDGNAVGIALSRGEELRLIDAGWE